ncbi:MAG: MBL fold metallo-hydrolase [Lachnospiraceae bacterium]|jgi:glyoxylase-like metal-dependent hydrolase (beta-lactamase superfamily II)|nr:MBL fold metallo-hydrolase [Lachnospiraceae bacterium]
MVEEVAKNIYRIGVLLPGNPLKELNSYLIHGEEGDLLIDTGFRCEACQKALEEGLSELGSIPEKRDVLVTHVHSDHSGMADLFAGKERKIYMSRIDLNYQKATLHGKRERNWQDQYVTEGFTEEEIRLILESNPAVTMALPDVDDRFFGVEDKMELMVGGYRLQLLLVPGHTPGNMMVWARDQGILFSGDHVLFDISPNITRWETRDDSLGDYLQSLERYRNLPVKLTLPGHRKSGDYEKRVEVLINHHQIRLQDTMRIVKENPGLTAYQIAGKMTWRIRAKSWEEFPLVQKWFAVGECLSHLDHLKKQGSVWGEQKAGNWCYFG